MSQAIGVGTMGSITMSKLSCKAKGKASKSAKVVQQSRKGQDQKLVGFGDKKLKEPLWQCVQGCGACCKLDKGPSFATPEEIFENPEDIQTYKNMVGTDGWCIHYDKDSRKCSIYEDRPYFCRVEPDVFQHLYEISNRKFNKEACSFCKDTIKAIYGADSEELDRFNKAIRS